MFIIRALFWLAILSMLIPAAAEGRHGRGAGTGTVKAVTATRSPSPAIVVFGRDQH